VYCWPQKEQTPFFFMSNGALFSNLFAFAQRPDDECDKSFSSQNSAEVCDLMYLELLQRVQFFRKLHGVVEDDSTEAEVLSTAEELQRNSNALKLSHLRIWLNQLNLSCDLADRQSYIADYPQQRKLLERLLEQQWATSLLRSSGESSTSISDEMASSTS